MNSKKTNLAAPEWNIPFPGSVAYNLGMENKKSEDAERGEPNHEKPRMSPAGFRLTAETVYYQTIPASRRKQMTAIRRNPRSSPHPKFDLYLMTDGFRYHYY
jgi:hypothetical protein